MPFTRTFHGLLIVVFHLLGLGHLLAAPPDLTAAGVIATIDRTYTYNLGPTGLRGWIYVSSGNVGPDGIITGESRQILVTVASAPANAVLAVDDVILGAMAGSSGTVPVFTSDARKAFGTAIGDAEKTGAGTLRVKRWRAGTTTDVNIPIAIMGDYSATAPYSCPKSAAILAAARTKLVGQLLANESILTNNFEGYVNGLALLAGVTPSDPNYAEVQSRLQTFARTRAAGGSQMVSKNMWEWAYCNLFLTEYYLSTGDANVVPGINNLTIALAKAQSINGTYGHGASATLYGAARRSTAYGPVNQVGIVANMSLVLGKKVLVAASQPIDAEIDPAIQRGSDFFAWFVNKGPIPYGEDEPYMENHAPNGKDALCAVFFGLQPSRTSETEFFTRMTTAGFNGREFGHTGQGFSYLWGAMGANMGGSLAVAEYLKPVRWHLDLERRTDGSFVYDGREQFGPGTTEDGTYLGSSSYFGLSPTASYILTYSLPLQRLYITGKNANSANTLDAAKVSNAITAATFKQNSAGKTNNELIAALNEYDPVVRHYAATALGARTLTTPELNSLIALLNSTSANERQGACQALGLLKNTTVLPTIVQKLNDPDSWVRGKAASAIRNYTAATASTYRDSMLTSFVANATDPNVINWSDPTQVSNRYLSLALFGNAVPDGSPGNDISAYTINAASNLLYPAIQVGLKQPNSYPRSGVADFCLSRLSVAQFQALYPDLFDVTAYECLSSRMWAAKPRAKGIETFAALKIREGISLALSMLEVPEGFEWGASEHLNSALNALAAYGDAARWTLPTLKGYLNTWNTAASEYATLITTISTIENAVSTPALNLGKAMANPQVVSTSGPKAITLTGTSPRSAVTFVNVTQPQHGTVTGTPPNLTYTPSSGYTGPDCFTFQAQDNLTTSDAATVSVIVGTAGAGLKAEYYDNADFTNLKLTRTDSQINFDWGTGSPDATIGADTFSVRWSGLLLVPKSGYYTFSTLSSDGVRLYVNGVNIIDNFTSHSTRWNDGSPIYLVGGQMADIQLLYYEYTGSAVAKLKWSGPTGDGPNGAIIPKEWLFDGSTFPNRPIYALSQSVNVAKNTPSAITLTGSGSTLSYLVLTQPANGTLSGTAPNLTYTPNTNFSGNDSFTFCVNNGSGYSAPATVSINVLGDPLSNYTWLNPISGNWSASGNWSPSAPGSAGAPNYSLNLSPSGTYTVTHDLGSGFKLNQLNTSGAVTIAGTQSLAFVANGGQMPQCNQNSANAVTINPPIELSSTTTFGGSYGGQVTLNGLISGSGTLIKTSPGLLQINNLNNTYTGGTIINGGTVTMPTGPGANTPFLGTGPITLNPNTTLFVNRSFLSNAITLNDGRVYGDNGFPSILSGPITLSGTATFDFATTGGFEITGNVGGSGGLITVGTTEWILSGTNTYTGTTTIQAGGIRYQTAAAVAPGDLVIGSGGKANLSYSGTRNVASLTLGGVSMPPGTYGSSASSATNKNDTYFTSTGVGTLTVLAPTTTALALTSGTTPASPGASMIFTATVSGSAPTGNVSFYDGSTLLGSSALNGTFQAAITLNNLSIGYHNITARYVGNAGNATSTSSPVSVEILHSPASAPTNLTATTNTTAISLTWSAAGATSYYVKRSTTSGGPYTIIGNVGTTSFTDTTMAYGVLYHYVVSAINEAGESPNSNQVSAKTKTPQTISFGALSSVTDATAPFALGATASSGLTVSYSSSNTAVATVSGNTLTVVGLGTTQITASQAGDATYGAAPDVTQSLTVERANPLAQPGGPYTVLYNQSLTLNGTASLPSANASITQYSWDLNNDNTFGDATGATPAAISFAALTGTWGMVQGNNTIQLRVTDSAGKSATSSTTVLLAPPLTWDANGTGAGQTNGAGAWLGANLWWQGSSNFSWIPGADAVFGGPSTNGGAVTLASPTSVGSITFNAFTSTYTLGTSGQNLTINKGIQKTSASNNVTISSPVVLGADQTFTNDSAGTFTFPNGTNLINNNGYQLTVDGTGTTTFGVINNTTAALTGAGALVKNGSGILSLGGTNTGFTGNVTINGGTLRVNSPASLNGNLKIADGIYEHYWNNPYTNSLGTGAGQIQITGGTSGFSENGSVSVTITLNNDAAFEVVWGSALFKPDTLVLQAPTAQSSSTLTFANKIDLNGTNRTIQVSGGTTGAASAVLSGSVRNSTGTAGLIKTGNGLLTFSVAPAYNGNTTVSAGTLKINAPNTNNNASTVTIAAGATLNLNFSGTDTVDNLFIDSTQLAAGVYKAVGSAATGTAIAQLAGTGTLTVTTGPDTTPPTLAGTAIVDSAGGAAVQVNTPLTYTLSFSEDIDATTLDATDFSNAGTSTISIGAIAETSPGVFTIGVTPTTTGTLQLAIRAGAMVQDLAGNALNTASAIADNTSLNVRSPFAYWSAGSGSTADLNNDGVPNGIAWLLGASDPAVSARSLLPVFSPADPDYFTYTYRRSDVAQAAPGTTISVQYGSSLASWTTAVHDGTNVIITTTNDGYGTGIDKVEVRIRKTLATTGKLFTRIQLITP